jgi:hypothetical protein
MVKSFFLTHLAPCANLPAMPVFSPGPEYAAHVTRLSALMSATPPQERSLVMFTDARASLHFYDDNVIEEEPNWQARARGIRADLKSLYPDLAASAVSVLVQEAVAVRRATWYKANRT